MSPIGIPDRAKRQSQGPMALPALSLSHLSKKWMSPIGPLADNTPEGGRSDSQIVEALGLSVRTVERVRQRFVEEGFEAALSPKPRSRIVSKLEKAEADVVELAKSDPPQGRKRWTLRLLADQAVHWAYLDNGLSHETVRQILKKRDKTLAGENLVYSSSSRCGVCFPHGRRVGTVPLAL
jgi:transposase